MKDRDRQAAVEVGPLRGVALENGRAGGRGGRACGLRVVELNAEDGREAVSVASGVVTCLSSMRVGERQHLLAWGEKDGTTQISDLIAKGSRPGAT